MSKLDEMKVEEIRERIEVAREFARKRFNAYQDEETTPSHLLAKLTCDVVFPDADKMMVCKILYGEPIWTTMRSARQSQWPSNWSGKQSKKREDGKRDDND